MYFSSHLVLKDKQSDNSNDMLNASVARIADIPTPGSLSLAPLA